MELITEFLVQVNAEAGKCENTFSLQQIEERLSFKISSDYVVSCIHCRYQRQRGLTMTMMLGFETDRAWETACNEGSHAAKGPLIFGCI